MDDDVFFNVMELCRVKKFDEARRKYQEFISAKDSEGTNPRHLSWLASIEGLSGNPELEIEIRLGILDRFPEYYSAGFMAARAFLKINSFQQAIRFGQATLTAEADLMDRPYSKAAAFLVSFAAMNLRDYNTFESCLNQFDDDHAEWFGERLWAKKDMVAVMSKNR